MKMKCPHCHQWAYTRTSAQVTITSRETVFRCTNDECGHVFAAVTEINRTISPSATPDPKVVLPLSRHIRKHTLSDQLQRMPEAEYRPLAPRLHGDLFDTLLPLDSPG